MKMLVSAMLMWLGLSRSAASLVSLKLDAATGAYSVSTADWKFDGLDYKMRMNNTTFCSCDGSLILTEHSVTKSSDGMGSYSATSLHWAMKGTQSTYATTFRLYDDAIIFQQDFPCALDGASGASFVAEFPAFGWDEKNTAAGYVTWNSIMSGDRLKAGTWPPTDGKFGAADGGPVVLFPKSESEQWTVVVSEASRFMEGGVGACDGKNQSLCSGLRGSYDTIPEGFSFETIMSISGKRGVANGMFEWGSKLLAKYGKQRTMPWEATSDYVSEIYLLDPGRRML
jgi:hypothetical protein